MNETISIRAYEPIVQTHSHDFHQVVVPLQGVIQIDIDNQQEELPVGHCALIKRNMVHSFSAEREARFLIVDLQDLPASTSLGSNTIASVSKEFQSFCHFAETQLSAYSDLELERNMITLFRNLLTRQVAVPKIDHRIARAISYIQSHITTDLKLQELADISALSVSQFKILFARHTGKTVTDYLLTLRMEKARALLLNTDTPVYLVAEFSGYSDHSSFSRRFRKHFGVTPNQCRTK